MSIETIRARLRSLVTTPGSPMQRANDDVAHLLAEVDRLHKLFADAGRDVTPAEAKAAADALRAFAGWVREHCNYSTCGCCADYRQGHNDAIDDVVTAAERRASELDAAAAGDE